LLTCTIDNDLSPIAGTGKHMQTTGLGLWNLLLVVGGGSVPSDPRLTNIIGNFDSRWLVKIRKIEKLAKNFAFGF
jgi:hypothetical protein